ncbi:hypothetical protein M409DRAFT_67133 [Zasmidium cellare ATCC 36951]|uniref:trimethyllysine dioxygenase n=1 Tax=Zasmidium cellare ATCC 36951 TaxID=1080233 RepID=A0A6A6CF04_ZASCE|nr:uncharacterized protein M409DRAFT_67133 [Zasmidium cellare ATCC 36951]KAF2165807.1 hypothetical protein M409DRAFT_67133 [Zasmidium cellare ATCC 36951]
MSKPLSPRHSPTKYPVQAQFFSWYGISVTQKAMIPVHAALRDVLRAEPLPSSNNRLGQDTPFDRLGGSPKAFKASAKPDHLLNARYRSHPIPRFEGEGVPPLSLLFENGELKVYDEAENHSTKVPGRWLRDNCSDSRNHDTAQRQINVFRGDINTDIANCEIAGDYITVTFGDGHKSKYPVASILKRRGYKMTQARFGIAPISIWDADIARAPPAVPYSAMVHKAGMASLLHKIRTWGFCVVENMPATPQATEQLLESIGPIRNTHYGAFYDFTADLSSKDTAYTSEALEPHTDNTYFTEPAGLQALHMLSHTEGTGGESSLVDGFGAAVQLYVEDREAYLTLSETGVYAHASGNDGISIQPSQAFPTLSHDPELGYLTQVRWNNADRAGVAADYDALDQWYDAAGKFDKILNDPKNQYWFQLEPGQTLLFDNWRVLHGRAAFTGKRRMCGGYIPRDDFISKYRIMCLSAEDINFSTVTG